VTLGNLAWKAWVDGLQPDELDCLDDVLKTIKYPREVQDATAQHQTGQPAVHTNSEAEPNHHNRPADVSPEFFPWKCFRTNGASLQNTLWINPLLDLLALQHVLGLEGSQTSDKVSNTQTETSPMTNMTPEEP